MISTKYFRSRTKFSLARCVFLFAMFLLVNGLHAQMSLSPTMDSGIDIFKLGDSISVYEHGLVKIQGGEHEVNNRKSYSYAFAPQGGKLFIINDIKFNSLLITFNHEKKLSLFSFVKLFNERGNFEKQKKAKVYYEKLKSYIESQWHKQGEPKTYYSADNYKHSGHEWRSGSTLVKLDMQSSGRKSGSIGLSFETIEAAR